MVAERDRVGAGGEQAVGELARDARAVGGVLAVDDAHVDVELVPQRRQPPLDCKLPGRAEDVGEEEDSQFSASAAEARTSMETWSPASFV